MPIVVKDRLTFSAVARSLGMGRYALYALLAAAGQHGAYSVSRRRLTPDDAEHIRARIGAYRYWLHKGTPYKRPCVYHSDVAEYLEVSYTQYKVWVRHYGLGHLLPGCLKRRALLPAETALIIEKLCCRADSGKGGPL